MHYNVLIYVPGCPTLLQSLVETVSLPRVGDHVALYAHKFDSDAGLYPVTMVVHWPSGGDGPDVIVRLPNAYLIDAFLKGDPENWSQCEGPYKVENLPKE